MLSATLKISTCSLSAAQKKKEMETKKCLPPGDRRRNTFTGDLLAGRLAADCWLVQLAEHQNFVYAKASKSVAKTLQTSKTSRHFNDLRLGQSVEYGNNRGVNGYWLKMP